MSSPQFTMGFEGFGTRKPRNKRRYGSKDPRKNQNPSVMDRIRARRRDELEDDKYFDDFDDDLDLDDEEELADIDDDDGSWSFEDDL